MEIKPNEIHVIIDKELNIYKPEDSIIGYFDNEEECAKKCEELNLNHFLEIESKVYNSEVKSRYTFMTLTSTIQFISSNIRSSLENNN